MHLIPVNCKLKNCKFCYVYFRIKNINTYWTPYYVQGTTTPTLIRHPDSNQAPKQNYNANDWMDSMSFLQRTKVSNGSPAVIPAPIP